MHSSSTHTRIPQKPVNSFLFVRFRRCKNSSPALPLAYKSTSAVASGMFTYQTAKAVVNCFQSPLGGVRFCCFSLVAEFTF